MPPDAALLFAAGFGTRMTPLTDRVPKPLIPVAGKSLFDHALDVVRGAGIGSVVANTHYHADQMAAHLHRRGVTQSFEPEILDTGGGLKAAVPLLRGEAVVTLNTDAVWTGPNPAAAALTAWDGARMDALMVLVPAGSATGHVGMGDFLMDAEGRLTKGPGLVYSGLQIVRSAPFTSIAEDRFSMHKVWDRMIGAGRLFGIIHQGGWCDVGRPDCIALAERLLETDDVRIRD